MNRYQKAWNSVYFLAHKSYYYKECDDKDIELIGELVNKEIPKKPKLNNHVLKCGCCYKELDCDYEYYVNREKELLIISNRTDSKYNYCPNCGQKIEWSD